MRKSAYSPAAWEREKASARARSAAKYHANKTNPEYVASERGRIATIIRRKRGHLTTLKRERGCIDCGRTDGRLDFDHRDGEVKLFNPTHGTHYSWQRMLAEIAKCDVRCAHCHGRKSAIRRWFGTDLPPEAFTQAALA